MAFVALRKKKRQPQPQWQQQAVAAAIAASYSLVIHSSLGLGGINFFMNKLGLIGLMGRLEQEKRAADN